MPESQLIQRQTSLSANIVQFCRFLRGHGFTVSVSEEADALRTLEVLSPFESGEMMRDALRCILTHTPSQVEKFDDLYAQYWKELKKAVDSKKNDKPKNKDKETPPKPKPDAQFQSLKDWLYGNKPKEDDEEMQLHQYSAGENLSQKDFSTLTDDELREVFEMIKLLAQRLARLRSRRQKHNKNGTLDLRRTLRKNLRRGGEMLELVKKKPGKQKTKLILICDVSKSMELYSRFLVHFAYAFQQVFKKIETFVFSTSLVRVTDVLKENDFNEMTEKLSQTVPQWSSGTRIGESLQQFISGQWSVVSGQSIEIKKSVQEQKENDVTNRLNKKTIVIILSDGWDTGAPELLSDAMQYIHRKSEKVIWLNPLAGNPKFEASTIGMAEAMPYIDVFASMHNLESLRQLSRLIG